MASLGGRWSAFSSLLRADRKQRPATLRIGRRGTAGTEDDACLQTPRGTGAPWSKNVGAEGVKRVIGDEAAPDEAPERIDGFARIASPDGLMERIVKAGARGLEDGEKFRFLFG